MPFLDFLFSPQAHKFRDGYNINHDTLAMVSPEARQKLIFYFIAEQLPEKLSKQDRLAYQKQKLKSIGLPRTFWMTAALFTPLVFGLYTKRLRIHKPAEVLFGLTLGGIMAPFATSIYSRVYQSRFVESNKVLQELAKKYSFGIYDFSVAKKEASIVQLLYTMDSPYDALHS